MTHSFSAGLGAVLVTGASSGIGAAVALEFARRGATVGCLSRRGLVPPAEEGDVRDRLIPLKADITDAVSAGQAIRDLVKPTGGLAGLVNGAGLHAETPSANLSDEDVRRVFETNFIGAFRMCRLAFPHLLITRGFIVNIGSFYDRLGVPGNLAYSASKAALASLTRTLGVEWAREGIRVINVAPGYVETELNQTFFASAKNREAIERRIPIGRLGEVAEVARLVVGFAQERVLFLTGETIYVDGGQGIRL